MATDLTFNSNQSASGAVFRCWRHGHTQVQSAVIQFSVSVRVHHSHVIHVTILPQGGRHFAFRLQKEMTFFKKFHWNSLEDKVSIFLKLVFKWFDNGRAWSERWITSWKTSPALKMSTKTPSRIIIGQVMILASPVRKESNILRNQIWTKIFTFLM